MTDAQSFANQTMRHNLVVCPSIPFSYSYQLTQRRAMAHTCASCGRQFASNVSLDRHGPKCPKQRQRTSPEAGTINSIGNVYVSNHQTCVMTVQATSIHQKTHPLYAQCAQVASSASPDTSKTMCLTAICHWLMYHPVRPLLPNLRIDMPRRQWRPRTHNLMPYKLQSTS